MECAWKGRASRCLGPPRRRCGRCGAVAYCSASHQILHWSEHKEECKRLKEQMKHVDALNEFPFTFSVESTVQVCENQETRCSLLSKRSIHQLGMWLCECHCGTSLASFDCSRLIDSWDLPDILCPCNEPESPISKHLCNWIEYYEWRHIPLHSPVALLLHWPLTIYHATQTALGSRIFEISQKLHIHYLGPEKELLQLAVFAELHALFPGLEMQIELVGPAVPESRDGESITLSKYVHCLSTDCVCKSSENVSWGVQTSKISAITLNLRKGFYHDRYKDIAKESAPNLIIAPNAGVAAYPSWLPTIELIKEINVPAVFSDYCEEACNLGASCITSVTRRPLALPMTGAKPDHQSDSSQPCVVIKYDQLFNHDMARTCFGKANDKNGEKLAVAEVGRPCGLPSISNSTAEMSVAIQDCKSNPVVDWDGFAKMCDGINSLEHEAEQGRLA